MTSTLSSTKPSTIDNVPNEIWAAILVASHTIKRLEGKEVYKSSLSVTVAMSQVCSKWREIALATPGLWTYIHLRVEMSWQYPKAKLIDLWLKRSKNEPLFIELSIWGADIESQPRIHACLIGLFSHIARWKTASLNIKFIQWDPRSWYILRSSIATGDAPLLESLYLVLALGHIVDPNQVLPSMLWMNAPVLKRLVLRVQDLWGVNQSNPPQSWTIRNHIPYGHITHLQLASHNMEIFTWEHIFTIFICAPNLVSCFLGGVKNSRSPSFGTGQPIVLQHLQHLYLEASGLNADMLPGQLERTLTAPSLVTLTFSNAKLWNQESCTQFITESASSLDELHFVNLEISPRDFLECVRLSPTLRVLHLHGMDVMSDQEVARSMMEWDYTENRFAIVPNLQRLSFPRDPLSEIVSEGFRSTRRVLKKRLNPPNGSPKTFTTLAIPSSQQRTADTYLHTLCDEPWGMKVVPNDDMLTSRGLWKLYGDGS